MNNKTIKFICLNCLNKFKVNCENLFINDTEQRISCSGKILECIKCHSNTIIPFVTKTFKVTFECEYTLDISPVKNNIIGTNIYQEIDNLIRQSLSHDAKHIKVRTIEGERFKLTDMRDNSHNSSDSNHECPESE